MSKTLSNIEYLIATARVIVYDSKKLKDAISVGEDNTERENLRSAWTSIANSNKFYIASVERVAESMGMSISEAFLLPGTFTDWYIDSDKKYFAENMKRLRLEKGWKQSKLSSYAGVRQNIIRKCENSLGFPSVNNMQKIADALGVEIADMFLPPSGIADNDGGGTMNRHDMIFFNSILFLVIVEVLAVAFDNVGVASIAVVAMATEFASWKMIMVSDERARRRMERRTRQNALRGAVNDD